MDRVELSLSLHLKVIVVRETDEIVDVTIIIGCTEIGSNEPASVHGVKRELINVDEPGHQPAKAQADHGKNHCGFSVSIFQKRVMVRPVSLNKADLPQNPARQYGQAREKHHDKDRRRKFSDDI